MKEPCARSRSTARRSRGTQWTEVPDPVAGRRRGPLEIAASAVNRADIQQRQGHYPPPPGAPPYPGLECSGVIAATGPGVTGGVGDEVCALLAGGGYAEQVAVPGRAALPLPAGMASVDAAALPEVACTVWSNVVRIAPAPAAARRCWCTAVAAASARSPSSSARRSAPPWSTTARKAKHDALEELGADVTIDYTDAGLRRVDQDGHDGGRRRHPRHHRRASTSPATSTRSRPTGGIAIIGLQGGRKAELDLRALMAKRGIDLRDHAAGPPARREGRDRTGSTRAGVAADRRRADPPGDRPPGADGRRRRGAPAGRGERPPRQGAAGRLKPSSTRAPAAGRDASSVARVVQPAPLQRQAAAADAAGQLVAQPLQQRDPVVEPARASAPTAGTSRPWSAYGRPAARRAPSRISSRETPTCWAIRMNATRRSSPRSYRRWLPPVRPAPDQPIRLVVAQRRRRHPAARGQLADGRVSRSHHGSAGLEFK